MTEALRIRPRDVAHMTSLSVRKVQELAATRRIPGAAKLGGVWTFDPNQIKAWIRRQERVVCQEQDTYTGAARHGGGASELVAASIDEAFERLTRKRPRIGSRAGASASNAPQLDLPIVPLSKPPR